MTEGNRNLLDPTGWTAEKLEWLATIYLYGEKRVRSRKFVWRQCAACVKQHASGLLLQCIGCMTNNCLHVQHLFISVNLLIGRETWALACWASFCCPVKITGTWQPGLTAKVKQLSVLGWGQALPA